MLSMYILPMILRPLDFLANFKNYTLGFVAYMVMMPVFTNVFQIYAMCNLHDVSWGNRPTSTGQEAFTSNKNTAAQSEGDYKVYRTNFVLIWLVANAAYYIMIVELVDSSGGSTVRNSDSGYLAYFSIYLAGLVVFRVLFAVLHICKWKIRYNCSKHYKVKSVNLQQEFKKLKKQSDAGESTDDEIIKEELEKIYEQNRDKIDGLMETSRMMSSMHELPEVEHKNAKLDNTMLFVKTKDDEKGESDEDYDFKEFEDAEVEEAEDRIYSEYKRAQRTGSVLEPALLTELARNVPLDQLDSSVVLSALNGRFEPVRQTQRGKLDNSALDISAMM